jgi:hypothetical protein
MDKDLVQKLAEAVASQLSSHLPMVLIVQVVVVIVSAGIGAYFGEYFRTKGRNLATTADFQSLKKQLGDNTQLVETIKANISAADWAKREWTNLRRIKLEELLKLKGACETFLYTFENAAYRPSDPFNEHNPISDFETIAQLYFPELDSETYQFVAAFRDLIVITTRL